MVDDDDGDESPSSEPRTDSRSALPREIRAWRRLCIVKHDETFSRIFFLLESQYMELELASEGHQGAHEVGGHAPPRARPPILWAPWTSFDLNSNSIYTVSGRKKIKEKVSSRFMTRSRHQALISLGRAHLESVRGSGEGDSSPSSSSTILHHQFRDAHRRA